jgi:ABC-type amino acid transport substrate-binding protein
MRGGGDVIQRWQPDNGEMRRIDDATEDCDQYVEAGEYDAVIAERDAMKGEITELRALLADLITINAVDMYTWVTKAKNILRARG